MGKLNVRRLSKGKRDEIKRTVALTFGALGLDEYGQVLLRDLLAESEVVMLSRRLQVAHCLLHGYSFNEVATKQKVGLTTVRFVHEFLEDKFDDYQNFLFRLAEKEDCQVKQLTTPLGMPAFNMLKQRYPMNYVLFNTLLMDPKSLQNQEYS